MTRQHAHDRPSKSAERHDRGSPRVVWQGRHLQVVVRDDWEYVERQGVTGIVGIVAITDPGKLVLVEQHRTPLARRVIELPAGLAGDSVDTHGEALLDAARRELLEETGYEAAQWTHLFDGTASAGLSNEIITCFLARGLRKAGAGLGDGTEQIVLHEVPLAQVHPWLRQRLTEGLAVDYKVLAGLELARAHLPAGVMP